jgi:hypothetical protein
MRYLNSFGVVVYKLFLLVTILAVGVLTFAPTASAYVLYDGDAKSDPNKPWTWSQQEAPWSNNTWLGGYLGSSGCMIHSMTQILIKSGSVKKGYTPADFVNEARASGFRWGINAAGRGLFTPRLDIPSNGKIVSGTQVGSQAGAPLSSVSYDNLRDNVKSGKEYIFHVTFPGGGVHWMATDYVDKNNTLHIIDSGWPEGQDSTLKKALDTIGTYSKTNPSAYTEFSLKEGSWQTIDKNASVGGTETKTDDSKKDTAKSTEGSDLVPEDELTGMPDRNDYKAQGSLQLPGVGGYGAPDDSSDSDSGIDSNTKSDVQALKDANDNRIQAANSSLVWSAVALVGIAIFLYGCIILPMAFMFDRANTVFMFSMVSAVTFGRMRQMPVGMSEDELPKNKKGGYLTTKRLLVTVIGCFVVASLIFSGAYRDELLHVYYWVKDFLDNGGFGGNPNNMPSKG